MTDRTRECPSCASQVPVDHDVSDICGYEFPARGTPAPWVKRVAVSVLILIGLAFLIHVWRVYSR